MSVKKGIICIVTAAVILVFGASVLGKAAESGQTKARISDEAGSGIRYIKDSYIGSEQYMGAKSFESKWASSSGIEGNTAEEIADNKIKYLESVYDEKQELFIIQEKIAEEQITEFEMIQYMFGKSDLYRELVTVRDTLFIVPEINYSKSMGEDPVHYERFVFYLDQDAALDLAVSYTIQQGSVSVQVISEQGEVLYRQEACKSLNTAVPIELKKGLYSVVLGYVVEAGQNQGEMHIHGQI